MKINWCKIFGHKHIEYVVSSTGKKRKIIHSKCIRCDKQNNHFHGFFTN